MDYNEIIFMFGISVGYLAGVYFAARGLKQAEILRREVEQETLAIIKQVTNGREAELRSQIHAREKQIQALMKRLEVSDHEFVDA